MKPHLILIHGRWVCGVFGVFRFGYGATPLLAYDDWLLRELAA